MGWLKFPYEGFVDGGIDDEDGLGNPGVPVGAWTELFRTGEDIDRDALDAPSKSSKSSCRYSSSSTSTASFKVDGEGCGGIGCVVDGLLFPRFGLVDVGALVLYPDWAGFPPPIIPMGMP